MKLLRIRWLNLITLLVYPILINRAFTLQNKRKLIQHCRILCQEILFDRLCSIEPEVKRCSDGRDGKVIVDFVVSGATGRVTEASLLPSKLSGSIGHCVARAIRFAKFPKFEKNTLNIKYPFEFHLDQ